MGWFDKEFNFFGTTYFDQKEKYYLISSNPTQIYDYAYQSMCKGVYCTPVDVLVKKMSVPAGTEEQVARQIKIALGKQMQKKYSVALLKEFGESFGEIMNDTAKIELEIWQEKLDGLFDREKVQLFEALVDHAFNAKVLKRETYNNFRRWIIDVYADMEDDLVVKDTFHRELHCLSYFENGKQHMVINAQKDRLYVKERELMQKGIKASPIVGKTYWYNHEYRLTDVRKEYEEYLKGELMEIFFKTAERINNLPSAISEEYFQQVSESWLEKYGEGIKEYLEYYHMRWHVDNGENGEKKAFYQ